MKIGIVTLQKSEVNYGACLQSYALWKHVTNMGHDCDIIDILRPCHSGYRISPSFNEKKKPIKQRVKEIIISILNFRRIKQEKKLFGGKRRKFEEFNNLLKYTDTYYSVEELYNNPPSYDMYITGSDQVWNPKMPYINNQYFLTFVPKDKKKISYASSFGIDYLPESKKRQYGEWLLKYDSVSVREESGASIVEELTGKRPTVLLDPVFLLPKNEWSILASSINGILPNSYVFLYILEYDANYIQTAYEIAKELNLSIYMVLSDNRIIVSDCIKQLLDVGPREWLWLIKNANMVITSSFHGTAFSCIFNKPTKILLRESVATNSRTLGLLQRIDSDYISVCKNGINILSISGYDKDRLGECIKESYSYLEREVNNY